MTNLIRSSASIREYTPLASSDAMTRSLMDAIADTSTTTDEYRHSMHELGKKLAAGVLPKITSDESEDVYVVCTVEDADFLARGVIDELESRGFGSRIKLMCLWNTKVRDEGVSLSPILRQYKEDSSAATASFIVVKSIISGACVVKTNLTRALSTIEPAQVFVVSPVLLKGAQKRLSEEFPTEISNKFEYVWMATDSEKDGENVIPGIGGSVYERLGLGDEDRKNQYTPFIVKERRKNQQEAKVSGVAILKTAVPPRRAGLAGAKTATGRSTNVFHRSV